MEMELALMGREGRERSQDLHLGVLFFLPQMQVLLWELWYIRNKKFTEGRLQDAVFMRLSTMMGWNFVMIQLLWIPTLLGDSQQTQWLARLDVGGILTLVFHLFPSWRTEITFAQVLLEKVKHTSFPFTLFKTKSPSNIAYLFSYLILVITKTNVLGSVVLIIKIKNEPRKE